MVSEIYQVGIASEDITPPIGIRLTGYSVREGFSTAVLEPLLATALYVRGEETAVCLIAVDITFYPVPAATRLRQRCADALGINIAGVLINCNHTHSGPAIGRFWYPDDTPDQLAMQDEYDRKMCAAVLAACLAAAERAQDARLAVGWGECAANINRRQKTPDGDVVLGEDPDGPSDHSVGVLRFDDLGGKSIAAAFRFSCHTVTLGPRTNVISPDYIGPARRLIERQLGCPSMFLQGCAGNQNPITGIGQDDVNYEDTYRIGRMVGAEVVKVASGLRTHRRRKAPRFVRSVAVYWMYEYEDIPAGGPGRVSCSTQWMELPLEPFGDLDEMRKERDETAEALAAVIARGAGEAETAVATRFAAWAARRFEAAVNGPNPVRIPFPLQTITIGNVAICALPFEPMSEMGTDIREASPLPDTFVLGYSNGMVTYLPTPRVSAEGGMEARFGYKAYLLPSAIPGDWEPQIRNVALDMLKKEQNAL